MLNRLSIRSKLTLLAVLPIVAMVLLAALAYTTLSAVKVGGPAEQRVGDAKDVVADVLPPPLFVVEPLLVMEAAAHGGPFDDKKAELIARYERLRAEYVANHEKWVPKSLPDSLRDALLDTSYRSAMAIFEAIDDELVPAIRNGDTATAESLLVGKIEPMFDVHRNDVLKVIERAQAYEQAERAAVDRAVSLRGTIFAVGLVAAAGLTLALGMVIGGTIRTSILKLRKAASEDLPRVMADLATADDDALANASLEPIELGTRDELHDAADAFNSVLGTAVGLAAQQTLQRRHTSEMFVNLGRRNQNLVARQLKFIDGLERTETDGDRLAELFRLDNLATRMRRNAESLLVLAGVEAPRRWRKPLRLYDVVRGAIAEIEDFRRVEIGSFDEVQLQGASVANVTHLLAELVENATRFSPPDTTVTINGVDTGSGYLIGIHDRGLGMPADQLASANAGLSTVQRLDDVPTAYLGLFVVARLAQREGIDVELESPDGDGLSAWVRIPAELLGAGEGAPTSPVQAARAAAEQPATTGARRLEIAARADQLHANDHGARPSSERAASPSAPPRRLAAAPAAPPPAPPAVELQAPAAGARPPVGAQPPAVTSRPQGDPRPARGDAVVSSQDATSTLGAEAAAETKSGFKKRTRSEAKVEFDRFADRPVNTGNRSAEDIKDRLDRFSAGKRFATTRNDEAATPVEDDE